MLHRSHILPIPRKTLFHYIKKITFSFHSESKAPSREPLELPGNITHDFKLYLHVTVLPLASCFMENSVFIVIVYIVSKTALLQAVAVRLK